jgi:hypothetical protein
MASGAGRLYAAVFKYFETAISSSSVAVAGGSGGPVDGWRVPTVFQGSLFKRSLAGAKAIWKEIPHQNCALVRIGVMALYSLEVSDFCLKYGIKINSPFIQGMRGRRRGRKLKGLALVVSPSDLGRFGIGISVPLLQSVRFLLLPDQRRGHQNKNPARRGFC